ncbi:thermonuclease family protein [Polymorphum gilvum]|uniref:Nuclease n=1 Tax=Polymorphum gilvum (strain LMG 25793 / CGMCC 1.9160 / SL003B-26A1) TaxID=991905 RepID=F2IW65_POLGS|nr:hypothetical protein [Polymorphum gilvum]ADZ71450.1 hypothetical protein SL003B_3027 [Polymorphum gilvum SL003B-26A1]
MYRSVSRRLGRTATRVYLVLFVVVAAGNAVSFAFHDRLKSDLGAVSRHVAALWSREPAPEPAARLKPRYEAPPQRLTAPPLPPFARFEPQLALEPPYAVTAADAFTAGDVRIRLAFIDGLAAADLCLNVGLTRFPCGLMGRASMQNLVSNAPLTCRPVFYDEGDLRHACTLQGTDIAAHQVAAGFARPDHLGRLHLDRLAEAAAASRRGAWNGNWAVLSEDAMRRDETLLHRLDALKTSHRPTAPDAPADAANDPLGNDAQ